MKARHKLLTVFSVLGGLMAIAAVGWACTALVGPTYITDTDSPTSVTGSDLTGDGNDDTPDVPEASPGSTLSAKGFALKARQPGACAGGGEGADCDYELVTDTADAAFSCHFNDGTESDVSNDTTQKDAASGVIEMNGSVNAPTAVGPAVACFRSAETFSGSNAPAAGTSGAPLLVLN